MRDDSRSNPSMDDDKRRANREAMPNVAAMLDDFRKANPGLEFKVVYAKDYGTGVEVGTPTDMSNAWPIPPDLCPQKPAPTAQIKRRKR